MPPPSKIQIISAPSILGLKPSGVERLAETLLGNGLAEKIGASLPIINVSTLNHLYRYERDIATGCLNLQPLQEFSKLLSKAVTGSVTNENFTLVLGGDCSILLGITHALKKQGNYGLVFIDAHADFYEPEKSGTGEAADMDLALVTGRGPEILTDIDGEKPYVKDENVIHIGQRDGEETQEYGSQDIRDTPITCFDLEKVRHEGIDAVTESVLGGIDQLDCNGFWIHFDTDVLDDAINPAVDYRLPGGLTRDEAKYLLNALLQTGRVTGVSVSIYNPALDPCGTVGRMLTTMFESVFREE